jgi:hypothetical protein
MSEILPKMSQADDQGQRYFSFQIRGWTNFDPMNKTLARIAEDIEAGGGFLTLVEVVKSEENIASIDDEEVRECFENIIAAKRLIQNVHELPRKLVEELRSALKEEEVVPKKNVTAIPSLSSNEEPGSRRRWP